MNYQRILLKVNGHCSQTPLQISCLKETLKFLQRIIAWYFIFRCDAYNEIFAWCFIFRCETLQEVILCCGAEGT